MMRQRLLLTLILTSFLAVVVNQAFGQKTVMSVSLRALNGLLRAESGRNIARMVTQSRG